MLLDIRDTRLHVDQRGPEDAPPLLFLHGGPGSGSYDFMSFQGDRLSERLRLVGVDQRGVQHSDPLDGPVTEDDLIADFEALRQTLGFDRWSILGHSYGGRLALRYAVTHPGTVARVIFENPPWDMVLATRTLVDAALPLLTELGDEAGAEELLSHEGPATAAMWDARIALVQRLGDRRMEIYFGPDAQGAGRFAEEITRTPGFSESLLPYLERLTQSALLIKGGHDPVTSAEEIDLFQAQVPNGRFQLFDTAGHFVHAEQPEAYARLATDFILSSPPP
ncbi:MAG: proline iminopeptidase [Kribbellaceae bacterium]|nr:proline iminopeptidase [Kribbellaceae bacterium]